MPNIQMFFLSNIDLLASLYVVKETFVKCFFDLSGGVNVYVALWYFGRRGNVENAIITFILTLYLIIVSTTDNTMNYPLHTGVLAMLMIGNAFEENVRQSEHKMFGYISNTNQKEESETLL